MRADSCLFFLQATLALSNGLNLGPWWMLASIVGIVALSVYRIRRVQRTHEEGA